MATDRVCTLSLNAHADSSITRLSLYTDRARITREFKIKLPQGQTKLTLTTLPNVIDHDSLRYVNKILVLYVTYYINAHRIEGRGNAIIQGVTSSKTPLPDNSVRPLIILELERKRDSAKEALARAKKIVESIDGYMGKLDVENFDISILGHAMEVFDNTGKTWDDKIYDISEEIQNIDKQIEDETTKVEQASTSKKLRSVIAIDLFAHEAADVELILTYTVSHASWESAYDVRVDSTDPSSKVNMLYKAVISQETGEDWIDVPITLETSQPSFGVEVPVLPSWTVSHTASGGGRGLGKGGAMRHRRILPDADDLDYMPSNDTVVTSKGYVNATFRVPGRTTVRASVIDYDEDEDEQRQHQARTVTVTSLDLEKEMSWVCVPKGDPRVHMMAKIKNESEYTFLPGRCNVYVDQSYVANIDMARVSPKETFNCPLGLDPSIRLTYHPTSKFVSTSGFLSRVTTHSLTQTISIHNTKSIPIHDLKILDHVPVSTDEDITVKLINPALIMPPPPNAGYNASNMDKQIEVSDGIMAQWARKDDSSTDATALGKDGKMEWVCAMDAFGKVNLVLQWELSTSSREKVYGL
ncbi:hypothetical protein CPB83DRAFT_635276 [Crepidotus variabilis]|uniref:Mucoidy inhibitor A n=1 Tax=Crepidotus variabilis TaxID=179855 RepID=A0A9P6EPB6_9AGAR|nr:hypothetical protein CPB83DRAFT_635276 [Crepidotus variabilis]